MILLKLQFDVTPVFEWIGVDWGLTMEREGSCEALTRIYQTKRCLKMVCKNPKCFIAISFQPSSSTIIPSLFYLTEPNKSHTTCCPQYAIYKVKYQHLFPCMNIACKKPTANLQTHDNMTVSPDTSTVYSELC